MSESTISLLQLFKLFPDEASARAYFEAELAATTSPWRP
jgi:hypothetical protein